ALLGAAAAPPVPPPPRLSPFFVLPLPWVFPVPHPPLPPGTRCPRALPRVGADGHPLRWGRRVSAAQGRALGDRRGGRRSCADLHPQGKRIGGCRAALSRPPLCPGR